MLYKNNSETLDMKLFENPTSEYRAAPFWAWNCELDEKELLWQIENLKSMGFGGFYMHTRSGMATEYLSDDFMKLVKSCTDKAKREGMFAYLYDEDRWPSGAAGGYVTKNYPKYRQRRLFFTLNKRAVLDKNEAIEKGKTYLAGMYDITLNERGELKEYKKIENEDEAKGFVRYAYVEVFSSFNKSPGWYNGGTYVDTLSPEAMQKFVEITHEKYKEAVGDEFGKTVPAIFTDEPQFSHYVALPTAESKADVALPWTIDIEETFFDSYGYRIEDKLPEIFWELENSKPSLARYHFHDHVCERFASAYADTIGNWCEKNGISLTGHLYGEYTLRGQARFSGEAMRSYRSYQLPGVDMLFNTKEYSTVKQVQSSARQYGREGGMSECYGVTNWDFDFRGHKFQGDWQAALGITVRVPHLAWVSMKGAAKRDYPASINYQSPWFREYSYIEDHFARLNTVLTRGKPLVNVGVIHPIESYWLRFGPEGATGALRDELDEKFDNIVKWLLFDNIDFDFVCESSLPELGSVSDGKFSVGKMSYSTIVVPACETLRGTTVKMLSDFIANGGNVIFAGTLPKYIDAVENGDIKNVFENAQIINFDKYSILKALEHERTVGFKDGRGKNPGQFIYQLREDEDADYLFVANANPIIDNILSYSTIPPCKTRIRIKGEYCATLLNTFTGTEDAVTFKAEDGYTTVWYDFYENDSLLLKLVKSEKSEHTLPEIKTTEKTRIDFRHNVSFKRHEDNVCLLDLAEYSLDGGNFEEKEEILRIDKKLRQNFSWPMASGQDMQPWAMEKEETTHFVTLKYDFESQVDITNAFFCAEELEELTLNGKKIELCEKGYFVDKSIKKYALDSIVKGKNEIIARIPFAKEKSLEACYLTGDFDVILSGCEKTLTPPRTKIGFGDIVSQGMPFYGGNITYTEKINLSEKSNLCVNVAGYCGTLSKVRLDGKDVGYVVFAPYDLHIENVEAGEHTLEFVLFGNRHNTFGGLHNCGISIYYGQGYWYSTENSWSYEYNLRKTGIMKSPVIKVY